MNIGIADDHPFIIEAYRNVLVDFDVAIKLAAHDGRDFIEKFEKLEKKLFPDIVITDISMPFINGFEVVEWLKKNHPDVKIIVCTMYQDSQTVIDMLKLGINCFVHKNDLTFDLLREMIGKVIKEGSYFSDRVAKIAINSFHNKDTSSSEKLNSLTDKEKLVIKLICSELTGSEMAQKLNISIRTIESLKDSVFSKLDVKSRVGIALFAQKNGLLN